MSVSVEDESPAVDTPETEDGDQGDERLTRAEKRLLIGLGAAGLVVLLIVLAINVFGGDDGPNAVEPGTAENAAEVFADGGGIVEAPAKLPPLGDPVVDDLDRPELDGGPLGWETLGDGSWSLDDGVMESSTEPDDASALAVATVPDDLGDDWAFSISVEKPAQNAGFAWAVEDADNYWELRSNQEYAAVVVNRVQDGKTTQVKIIGPSGLAEGQRFTVAHQGDTITIAESGAPFLAVSDESFTEPRKVGVIASTEASAGFTDPELAAIDG